MNKLWSLPAVTVYLYTVTILTQYGYNSYFKIPSNFIEFSIKSNIIYFYQLFQLGTGIAGLMRWWMWIVLIFLALLFVFLFFLNKILRIVLVTLTIPALFYIIGPGSYKFGFLIAKNTSSFYIPVNQCFSQNNYNNFVIPTFYESKAILIPIDQNTNKMQGGFIVKEVSEIQCPIEQKEVGNIIK